MTPKSPAPCKTDAPSAPGTLGPVRKCVVGIQFLFVAFGGTVLMPLLVGLEPSTALFTAGVGTLLFHAVTKGKVPVFLGSSFAFIAPILAVSAEWGLDAAVGGFLGVAAAYLAASALVRWRGTEFLDRVFPPVVVGPTIVLIGLSLAGGAVTMAQADWLLALVSLAVVSEKLRLYNRGDFIEVTFFLPNGEDLMLQLPRESLKMPMINPNIGQSVQQSVVYDPITGQSRIQTSVVPTPGIKRSLYDEIRQRPGFGVPFVDSYGDEGFFETGLPSKFVGSAIATSVPLGSSLPVAASVPLGTSVVSGNGLANSGIGLAQSGVGLTTSGVGGTGLATSGIGASGLNNFA